MKVRNFCVVVVVFFLLDLGSCKKASKKEILNIKDISTSEDLKDLLEANDYVAIIFYDKQSTKNFKVIQKLDKFDLTAKLPPDLALAKMDNDEEALEYGLQLGQLPRLVLFENGIPEEYPGADLTDPYAIIEWVKDEMLSEDIETLMSVDTLEKVVDSGRSILALFTEKGGDRKNFPGEEALKEAGEKFDIELVKVEDPLGVADKYGITELPAVIYFEREIPTIYETEGEIVITEALVEDLVEWIEIRRTSDNIENVNEEILQALIVDQEYIAVFFTGPCDDRVASTVDLECKTVLQELENIDDDLDDFGITLVTTNDIKYAGHALKVRKFPALGIFRNGDFLLYRGSLKNEKDLFNWLVDEETLEIQGKIEEVNKRMLKKILEEESDVVALLYKDPPNKITEDILKKMEMLDESLDKIDVEFVKCSDPDIEEEFGFHDLPVLVYFENQIPRAFDGTHDELKNEKMIYKWIMEQFEMNDIPTVDFPVLEKLIENLDDLLVIFYDPTKTKHNEFLEELETIDDDAEKLDIFMVKIGEITIARQEFGLFTLPALIHYEDGVPNVYDEDLTKEEILDWLEDQKTGSFIEKVTGKIVQNLITDEEYVAVLFLSNCEKDEELCETILRDLEEIDEKLDVLGIHFVYIDDNQYAAKLKITTFPSVALFRNGERIMYQGSVENEMAVLKFLTDLKNLVLPGVIEDVGIELLNHLMKEEKDVFAFLYDEDHKRAQKILNKLEKIDDDINEIFVKCSDSGVEEEYGIGFLPRLIYFEDRIPEAFTGDEMNEEEVLKWMKSELAKDEIKSVTRPMLERLIEKEDHIGVFFVDDEDKEEMVIIKELEKNMDKLRQEDLVLVMIDDPDWENQLGLTDPPTLVHFTGDIPSVYSGEETVKDIIYWLDTMKTDYVIEEVTEKILEDLVEEKEYVAIFFKGGSDWMDKLEVLEQIDDDLNGIGIAFVQLDSEDYAYRLHGITKFPALGLYRNGDFLLYEDSKDFEGDELRNWLMDQNNLLIPGVIEEVSNAMLQYFYENNDKLVVLFYEESDRDADEIIERFERIDEELDELKVSLIKVSDEGAEEQYGITDLPALVYFQSGVPNIYDEPLEDDEQKILEWIREETRSTKILDVTSILLDKMLDKFSYLTVVFYDMEEDPQVANLQGIAKTCHDHDIAVLKINDADEAEKYGLRDKEMPQILFFREKVPSLMVNVDVEKADEVLEWILRGHSSTLIEEVTDEILSDLIETHEYVAVYFKGACGNVDCEAILSEFETIDDDLDNIGILFVTTSDTEVAFENGVSDFPAIGLFRNGQFVVYSGDDRNNEKTIYKWLTDEETLKIIGIIDEVNLAMLENILDEEDDAFVFFYEDNDTDAHTILEELERIDEKLDQQDLTLVKISDEGAADSFGIEEVPTLVYFENGIPELYEGDLINDKAVMKWMRAELKQNEIKDVTVKMLDRLIEREKTMAVLFYDPKENSQILDELEHIDDDCAKYEINFIKVRDAAEASEYGIDTLPGLLYFEKKIPSIYDGDLSDEDQLLEWLIQQKTTDTIERVTEEILETLIEDEEYLAVFFSGPFDEDSSRILEELEKIDSIMEDHGIMLIMTEERELARIYDVRSFPALGLFRNGDFVPYEGDLEDEMSVLEWITDKSTLSLPGKIESVNYEMLRYLLRTETDVLAYLYRENNIMDEKILLEVLEHIDDELEESGVEFVKCDEKGINKKHGLGNLPLLVHFHDHVPIVYKGEMDEDSVLAWITASLQKKDIETVNGPILDVLIDDLDNLAAIFYTDETADFLNGMEEIDDELDDIGVPLVKIEDETKALQFGIEDFPTLVYFKKEVPGLFDGDTKNFQEIFAWLSERKKANKIQLISEPIIEDLVDRFKYLVILFTGNCKEEDKECRETLEEVLSGIEDINDDIENLGINVVMTNQKKLAKSEFGITKFPALGFFRNGGNFIAYDNDGDLDLMDEAKILLWIQNTDTLEVKGQIEDVNADILRHIIESEDDVIVLFYEEDDADLEEILEQMEKIDDTCDNEEVGFLMVNDKDDVLDEYGLTLIPSLVYFENGVPTVYPEDLKNADAMLGWVTKHLREMSITEINSLALDSLLERNDYVAVVYYSKNGAADQSILKKLEAIVGDCKDNDINFVKNSDPKTFEKLGIESTPVLIYYENGIPNLYSDSLYTDKASLVLDWLLDQRTGASIELVTDEILEELVQDNEYVAVLFTGLCAGDDQDQAECIKVIRELEKIDHTLDEYGIVFVMTRELGRAQGHWISRFPALALYRNGEYVRYDGPDLSQEQAVLKWLTAEKTLSIPGQIEKVNDLMLMKFLKGGDENIFVFFYEKGDVFAEKILRGLEELDSQLEAEGVDFVKINDDGIEKEYELEELPALVHFKNGEMLEFYGDFRQNDVIAAWIDGETAVERKKFNKKKKSKKA